MPRDFPAIHRTVAAGLPVYWAETPRPFVAGLVFRVGRADEQLTHGGITHLVEHLALPAGRVQGVEFNGSVSNSTTWFWASGEKGAALDLLRTTAAAMSELPSRMEQERGILLAEAARRGGSPLEFAASLRFGATTHGEVGYPEFGLRWLKLDDASAWARERFTAGNAALWMTGEPPPDLDLALPAGGRRAAPEPLLLPVVHFPSIFAHASPGGAAVAFLMERSAAAMIVVSAALERARNRLRYERGLSYVVDLSWEPLTDAVADVVLWCDCQRGSEREAGRLLREIVDELAEHGPTEEELQREVSDRATRFADPSGLSGLLFGSAVDELFGGRLEQPREIVDGFAAVTPNATAAALEAGLQTALSLTDDSKAQPEGRWSLYPLFSEEALSGREYRPAGPRRSRPKVTLRAGDDGVTHIDADGNAITVRFSECELVERWPDGTLVLVGRDACRLLVVPHAWQNGTRLVTSILAAVSAELVVPMNPEVEQRVDELAVALVKELDSALSRELRWGSASLDFGEIPLEAVGAKLGDKLGLLIVTHRRFVFSFGGAWSTSHCTESRLFSDAAARGTSTDVGRPERRRDVRLR